MQKLKPINKKGQLGLDLVKTVIVTFVVLIVLAVAGMLAVVSLKDSNIFTNASTEDVAVDNIVANYSNALSSFFSNTGTIFTILFAVVIISAIAIVIVVVNRFGGSGGARGL